MTSTLVVASSEPFRAASISRWHGSRLAMRTSGGVDEDVRVDARAWTQVMSRPIESTIRRFIRGQSSTGRPRLNSSFAAAARARRAAAGG